MWFNQIQRQQQQQQPPADPNNLLVPDGSESGSNYGSADEEQEPDVMVAFEDENGNDKANALSDAIKAVAGYVWDEGDLKFSFGQIETRMAAAGVKKQFTKLQVLTTILPARMLAQVKPMLRKTETDFEENNAYKLLKDKILTIFAPKKDQRMEEALSLVLTGQPSQLARDLVDKICKNDLDCDCCPDIILCLWKRQLSSAVKAGIAHCEFNKDTFENVITLADAIHFNTSNGGAAVVAAVGQVQSQLDETLPAIPYATPEVAAVRGSRGGGRGYRGGRGNRGGNRGNGRGGGATNTESAQNGQGGRGRGPRHPDGPPDRACRQHWKWGKSSYFCVEPLTCPWKNHIAPRSNSNQ